MQDEVLLKKLERRSRKISTKSFFGKSESTVDGSIKEDGKKIGRNSVDLRVMEEREKCDGEYERILDY